jgi:hypothetical protein
VDNRDGDVAELHALAEVLLQLMVLGSSNAQKTQRVYNAYRFRSQKGNSG